MSRYVSSAIAIVAGVMLFVGVIVAQSSSVITIENADQITFFGGLANDSPSTYGLAFDAEHLAVSTDKQILYINTIDGASQVVWETTNEPASNLYLVGDNLYFQTPTTIHQLDLKIGLDTVIYEAQSGEIRSLAVSETTIAMGFDGGHLQILDGVTFASITQAAVVTLAFNPTSTHLAAGYADGTLAIWDMQADGFQTLVGHRVGRTLYDIDFSPDGTLLASASRDGTVRLWDVASGEERYSFETKVRALDFSPDGQLLAGGDKTLRLWDTATGTQYYEFFHSDTTINARHLSFSPDGTFLVSSSRRLAFWGVDSLRIQQLTLMAVPDNRLEAGVRLYRRYGCGSCHFDYRSSAPMLKDVASVGSRIPTMTTEDYIYRSILYPDEYVVRGFPRGIHPGYYADTMPEEDAWLLVEYILSLAENK